VKRRAKLTGCRIKSGMTIESPKQKRGGASRPKDNFIIPPFGSSAYAAWLLLLLSRGSSIPLAEGLPPGAKRRLSLGARG